MNQGHHSWSLATLLLKVVVAHVIIVSAQVLLVLTLGLWTLDLGLTITSHGKRIFP